MSTKSLERIVPLLMAVLMITTAFIPAVSAMAPTTAASNTETGGHSFAGTTPSIAEASTAASATASNDQSAAKNKKNQSLWSPENWAQPMSGTNATGYSPVEVDYVEEPGMDVSHKAGVERVVTGPGKTKVKVHDPETRTIRIKDASKSAGNGDDELEIRLVNATPDLGTFTEIFEITAHRTIALDESEDFLATWALHNGNENITRAEWFVRESLSHTVEIPIIEYRDVTFETGAPEESSLEAVSLENITSENSTSKSVTTEEATLKTATVREPYIAGTETVEQSWPEWVPFDPAGQTLNAGETRQFKVAYTKPAEIGQVDINTAPVFRGVACPEMTWWSTSWTTRVPITVTNPPSIDGYSHCEVVSFRDGMQSDFDDVRFVTDDGTVLDYWKESYTASDSATIRVNLPAGATSIWMYYGNAAATDIGDRNNAYILYDDFGGTSIDTTLWTESTPGGNVVSNGWVVNDRYSGGLTSNADIITNSEPVIVEMRLQASSLPSNAGYTAGSFPLFVDNVYNGLYWYKESSSWDRYVFVNGAAAMYPGTQRGLTVGYDYYNTWIITPDAQTHSVSGTVSYSDALTGATGITNHRMYILGGDDAVSGRVVQMDWIRVRKYVETEPVFAYGTPQVFPVLTTITVTPSSADLTVGETCPFTATPYDQYGGVMDGITFTWASSNETVGVVTGDGVFSAQYEGTSEISATSGAVSGTAQVTVTPAVTYGSAWNWSVDGWDGWSHAASWSGYQTGSCAEYGPVMVDDYGQHGMDVHLSAGSGIATVEHEFTDPSGVGWDSLTLVARVQGSDVPYGRWMTIEVNDEVVYSESGFSCYDPENLVPRDFMADFSQSDTVRVKISHGQNPLWGVRVAMDYYSLELHSSSSSPPSPITITSPLDDTVPSGENVTVAGNVSDTSIPSLTLTHNGVPSTIPVQDGNFSAVVNLTAANTIVISGTDSLGNPISTTLLLDGDMLPADFEESIGFDPLDADSNCTQWAGDQADNEVIDGYEVFAGTLPVFAKYRIGADPFVEDSDEDGLTDDFELLKLGTFPEDPEMMMLMGGEGSCVLAAGTSDDPDGDGLSNIDEQTYGTDPLQADTDGDDLSDPDEIQLGTDPCTADSDGDGLLDGNEVALGTNPMDADSDDDSILDGAESYWSGDCFVDDTLDVMVYGRGYAIANVSVAEVNYTHLISEEILVSKVYDIGLGDGVDSGTIEIAYDPTVENASNLLAYRFDEDLGTFVNVSSVVDPWNEVVICNVAESAKYAVLDSVEWAALFEDSEVETEMLMMACPGELMNALFAENYLDEENYILAVDERYPLRTPPEVELVEGVDYGVIPYDIAATMSEYETLGGLESTGFVGTSEPILLSSGGGEYQAVSNGDFSNDLDDWAPGSPVYFNAGDYGHEIEVIDLDGSNDRCLRMFLWNTGRLHSLTQYQVAHANVDMTGVDTLTFKYKCPYFERGDGLTTCALEFRIDGAIVRYFPQTSVVNDWQYQSIGVSGYTGMHTIAFNAYLYYEDTVEDSYSHVTFYIDDVSALSIQQPAAPDTANVRFFVCDSQTNEGVNSASVYCNNEYKYTDRNGYTNDFFLHSSGVYEYSVVRDGYTTHEGVIKVTLGESTTNYAIINTISAPTGSIRVTSDPNQAEIYIDDIFSGGTDDTVSDLLAGNHTVEVRKNGYATAANNSVEVTSAATTLVSFTLIGDTGTIAVTSSPAEAAVYLDNRYQGTTAEVSGLLTLPSVFVGNHTVTVQKDGYAPFTATVTVTKDQTTSVTAELNNDDADEDGLLDYYEEHGYKDGFGNTHLPDSYLVDTDGDGLSDGYEAGDPITDAHGKTYFKQRSDPTKADTDGDGLDDYLEDAIESDPLCPDSDGDGLSDALEWNTVGTDFWSADTDEDGHSDYEEWYDPDYDPLVYEERYGPLEMGREFLLGAVLGEWGADDHDNIYYLGGWVASGVVVLGDLRDIAATISRGDLIGTGLTLVALIPGYGDAAKAAEVIGKFVLKHPEMLKPAMILLVGIAPHVDEAAEAINNIRKAHGDEMIDRLLINGITEDELKVVVRSRGNLLRTMAVAKRADGKVIWLEEGKLGTAAGATSWVYDKEGGTGWVHIVNNHIINPNSGNQFLPLGGQYANIELVKELILDCAKTGLPDPKDSVVYWKKINDRYLKVVIGDNGYLRTAYAPRLKEVPPHIQSMFS